MGLLKFFLKIDIFGRDLMFEENDVQAYKTYIGSCLTILAIISVSIIGFLFGSEIYNRINPTVISSEEMIEESIVKASDYPIIFYFMDGDSLQNYDIDSVFDFHIFTINFSHQMVSEFTSTTFGLVECNPDHYNREKEFVQRKIEGAKANKQKLFCLPFSEDTIFKNTEASPNSDAYVLRILDCTPEMRARIGDTRPCNPVDFNRKKVFVYAYYRDSYLNPKNYTDPINYYDSTIGYQFAGDLSNRLYIGLTVNKIVTDYGWILEDEQEQEYVSVGSIQARTNSVIDNERWSLVVHSPNIRKKTTRNYLKIQELFAKIGGLFNAITIIVNVLTYDYIRFKYRVHYSKYIVSQSTNFSKCANESVDKDNSRGVLSDINAESKKKMASIANNYLVKSNENTDNNKLIPGNINPKEENPLNKINLFAPKVSPLRKTSDKANMEKNEDKEDSRKDMDEEREPRDSKVKNVQDNDISRSNIIEKKEKGTKEEMKKKEEKGRESPLNNNFMQNPKKKSKKSTINKILEKNEAQKEENPVSSRQSNQEKIRALNGVYYFFYVFRRVFFCCRKSLPCSQPSVEYLLSKKLMKSFSFENYLNKLRVIEEQEESVQECK
mmetsp:Transcript_1542/g.1503  ORF Transcript_1542/g.1503 Transcript_1542/m.1503 type:complete len:609 (-) Transcript_1542:79-1905(-)